MKRLLPFEKAPWGAECANRTAVGDSQAFRKCTAARSTGLTTSSCGPLGERDAPRDVLSVGSDIKRGVISMRCRSVLAMTAMAAAIAVSAPAFAQPHHGGCHGGHWGGAALGGFAAGALSWQRTGGTPLLLR